MYMEAVLSGSLFYKGGIYKMTYTLITGASGGIGMELAQIMAAHNHNLLLVARTADKLSSLADKLHKKYNINTHVFTADLTQSDERIKLLDFIEELDLAIDILVNNAGFGDAGFFAEADWLKNEQMIQLNITALTHLTRAILPSMIQRGSGKILNVASIAGFLPGPLMSVYYATKAYVVSFSAALHSELVNTGVTVTTLSPGPVATNFFNAASAGDARITKIMKPAAASKVAMFAYRRLMKGKNKAVYGWSNYLMVKMLNFTPHSISNAMVKKLHT